MSSDRNFDDITHRFKRNIYDSPKGIIRLEIVYEDMINNIPEISEKPLNILDAGAGMGHMALKLAELDHHLTLCDISAEMLDFARQRFERHKRLSQATFIQSAAQELDQTVKQQFDLVLFHAVLEWVQQPQQILNILNSHIKPGGYLSLMFYNINSIIFYNLIKGNFKKVQSGEFKGHPGGLTPTNPINPDDVETWLAEIGMQVVARSGVRVIYDYMPRHVRDQRSIDDLLLMEKSYARQQPFQSMGRYLHFVCKKTG